MSTAGFVCDLPGEPGYQLHEIKDRNRLMKTVRRREIANPNEGMREIHKRLIRYLRDLKIPLPNATGAVPGGSPVANVQHHLGSRYFYITDISDAYRSARLDRLVQVMCEIDTQWIGLEDELRDFLEAYCFHCSGGLMVGFPASPDLFNLYSGRLLDQRLGELCSSHGIVYTRYLDDLVFSSTKPIGKRIRVLIRVKIAEAGFRICHRKSRVLDLTKKPIVINGIGLEWRDGSNRIFLPRHFTRRINGILRRAIKRGDIKREVVTGHMGVFLNTLDPLNINSTESRVLERYRRWRKIVDGWEQLRLMR